MPEPTLPYQRGLPGGISPTRRRCALHLKTWAALLLLFALLLAWVLFDRIVMERVSGYLPEFDPKLGPIWRLHYRWVFHWRRLVWVAAAMAPALALAASYFFLARTILRTRQRIYPIAALVLTMLHALAATLLLLLFFLAGTLNLHWGATTLATAAASLLGLLMVPGMLYLSARLMDLLRERPEVLRTVAEADTA